MAKYTIKQRIYSLVYESIVEGEYKENDILTESFLAKKYNVSKSPVREALIELCKENVMRNIPRTGYQVVSVSLKEFLEILEFRLDLEVMLVRKAYPKIGQKEIDKLKELARPSLDDDQRVMLHWNQNLRFHLALCKIYDNDTAFDVLQELLKKCSRSISQYFYSAWKQSRESNSFYHKAIIDALEQKNLDLACEMLTKDIMVVKEEIRQLF